MTENVTEILTHLKSALNIRTDAELARVFNISSGLLATWKARNSIDHSKVISLCEENNIDLNVAFGLKIDNMRTPKIEKPGADAPGVSNDLLVQTLLKNVSLLEERLAVSEATLKRAKELETQLIATQAELVKVQAQLIESQKKLDAALETIATLKKKKAA